MQGNLFYRNSPIVVLLLTTAILLIAAHIGFLLGRKTRSGILDNPQYEIIQTSVIGLLALLLGFTFSSAMFRFDSRRVLVVKESNALGTTFLRSFMQPEPYRSRLVSQLADYIDLRAKTRDDINNRDDLIKLRAETETKQHLIWKETTALAREYPNSVITALLVSSLNDAIDAYALRIEAYHAQVPTVILWILAAISVLTLAFIGYGFGPANRHNWVTTLLLSLLIALVIVMIVDLDRPLAGPTAVSQQSMIDLRDFADNYLREYRRKID